MRYYLLLLVAIYAVSLTSAQETHVAVDSVSKQSLFNYIYEQPERVHITINTDAKHLLRTSSKKKYQPASVLIEIKDKEPIDLVGDIKARGHMRKIVCRIPPVKLNFDKEALDSLGFSQLDKLKFVFPCNDNSFNQEKLYKEYLLYGLYDLIDTNGLRAVLIDVTMKYEGEEKFDFVGFMVEDEDNYAARKNGTIIQSGKLTDAGLDRFSFANVMFFNYMIANSDWSVRNRHNLEMVKLKSMERSIGVPYDFDYAGFVGQTYAVPHGSLPIESVHERYWFSYKLSNREFMNSLNYYKSLKPKIMEYLDTRITYMDESMIEDSKEYLQPFFKMLEKPEQFMKLAGKQ